MILDLQKASVLKRASAFLLDLILFSILAVGFAFLIGAVTQYNSYLQIDTEITNSYAEQYLGMKWEDYKTLSEEDRKPLAEAYQDFDKALLANEKYMHNSSLMLSLSLLMVSLGIFFAMLVLEFFVPLLLKNGQTVGKKVFGIGVMHTNGVRVRSIALFIRALLGKYTIETMFPFLVAVMFFFVDGFAWTALIILGGLLVLQIAIFAVSGTNAFIHDMISDTVSVDLASQMIFEDDQALATYKAKLAAQEAERASY